eukprot:gb/GECG01003416.1/.p1 GENE.gb/GECG01003416.1/~~gb/GECG01003416.1/.p1  ORF type:complete len:110 (+),score=4.74 gb/GECG01003416.1/:1-330(+)
MVWTLNSLAENASSLLLTCPGTCRQLSVSSVRWSQTERSLCAQKQYRIIWGTAVDKPVKLTGCRRNDSFPTSSWRVDSSNLTIRDSKSNSTIVLYLERTCLFANEHGGW